MSAAVETHRDDLEATYAVDFSREREPMKTRTRFPEYRRRGAAPSRVGGMHCRRNKRWTWGNGRGARVLNARGFAGCLAFAVASLAATAFGAPISIEMVVIGDPGNQGTPVPQPQLADQIRPDTGAVADVFRIGKYETTNAEYAAFLNAVDPTGLNPNSIYNPQMTTDQVNGGIQFLPGNGASGGWVAKSGFELKPVNYVNWFSAARFVNWLAGGQRNGSQGIADMEGGFAGSAYDLPSNRISGAVVPRNAGATFFLPSLDEFYKAAYYSGTANGSNYWTYGTQNDVAPLASTQVTDQSLANVSNYGLANGATTGVVDVDFYSNAFSAYGIYGAFGNVIELTDTPSPSNSGLVMGGGASWRAPQEAALNWSGAQIRYINGSTMSDSFGFRVAAVPEPGTMALAGAAVAGLACRHLVRRRRAAC